MLCYTAAAKETMMSHDKQNGAQAKQVWEKPELVRLGTIRDIAGPIGFGLQAGPNQRS